MIKQGKSQQNSTTQNIYKVDIKIINVTYQKEDK